jgi:hypothetical protein
LTSFSATKLPEVDTYSSPEYTTESELNNLVKTEHFTFRVEDDEASSSISMTLSSENVRLESMIKQVLEGSLNSKTEIISKNLNPIESAVVEAVLEKKQTASFAKKREEEKQKIFFKGLMKHTEKKFFDHVLNVKKYTKKQADDKIAYYEYYFGDLARAVGLNISKFFHPNKAIPNGKGKAKNKNPAFKSLNSSYISLILSSEVFKQEMFNYLGREFVSQHLETRTKKIHKLLKKLTDLASAITKANSHLSEQEKTDVICKDIKKYILTNCKAKLPWNNIELKETRDFANGVLCKQIPLQKILEHIN